jgi:DNA transposition AAA+ family ATPase
MSQSASNVATLRLPNIAPLRNVLLLRATMELLVKRSPNLPGIAALYGQAGLGKSNACSAAAAAYRAIYIEVRSHFTKKSFLLAILAEMAIKPERTTSEMVDQICQELMLSRRPLILDEGDYLVKRNLIELVRDLYEGSGAAILLVGEESFPKNLRRVSERFYDRILKWQPAELADRDDARKLANLYSHDIEIKDDLLARILEVSRGVARRIAVNIENVRQEAKKAGARTMDLDKWGTKAFYTGEAPARRSA